MHSLSLPAADLAALGPAVPETGRLLPEAAFSSLAYQAMEDAAIWSRSWVCIGFTAEIPAPGDILPFTVGHHGIHVERLAAQSFAARFNKAQHGGCRVVPLQCRTGTKTRCSFTACGYSRDRGPIGAADPDRDTQLNQYLGLRPERLLPVATATWGPLLFVQLDPQNAAAPLCPEHGSLVDGCEGASVGETVWREVAGNWKTVAIALAHRLESDADGVQLLFPNAIVRRVGDHIVVAILQPVALDRTLCRLRVFGPRATAQDPAMAAAAIDGLFQRQGLASGEGATPLHRDAQFEAAVARAIDMLEAETPTGSLFRTDEKGQW